MTKPSYQRKHLWTGSFRGLESMMATGRAESSCLDPRVGGRGDFRNSQRLLKLQRPPLVTHLLQQEYIHPQILLKQFYKSVVKYSNICANKGHSHPNHHSFVQDF